MRVAFYAPLKPPDHPVPSGDRRVARAFQDLLRDLGHEVELASRFRSFDRGDAARQERLGRVGRQLAERLVRRYRARPASGRPRLWFTYHLHHKAPDWLGPAVARGLGIPYCVAEASVAPRQAEGGWAHGFAASRAAIVAADLVLAMTAKDEAGLRLAVPRPQRILRFPPFLDTEPYARAAAGRDRARAALAAAWGLDPARPWLLAVAMMRDDAKRLSYAALAEALRGLGSPPWQLLLVGDGEARPAVERLFAGWADGRARFLGLLPPASLAEVYVAADLFVWPACREAYGMALLEAQAAGVPVVAGAEGGVPEVVAAPEAGVLVPPGEPAAFAAAVAGLLAEPERRRAMGRRAQAIVAERHGLPAARARLEAALARLAPLGAGAREEAACASA